METLMPDDPAVRFQHYVVRGVQAARARIDDHSYAFPDTVRDRARHVLDLALDLPAAWPATRDLLLALAPKMELAGHRDGWLYELGRGVACSEQWDDPLTGAELRLQMGLIHRLRGNFAAARRALETAAATFVELGVTHGQARAFNQLAYVAWSQNHIDEAERHAGAALALLPADDPERAMSLSALGLAAGARERWATAETHHRAALAIRQAQGDRRRMGWSLQNLAHALRGQQHYAAAIDDFHQAIALLTETGDVANCAIAQMDLGIAYGENLQSHLALQVYSLAEQSFRRLYDFYNLAKLRTCQGVDHLVLGNHGEATTALLEGIALAEKFGHRGLYLNALDGLGLVYLAKKEYAKALTIFEEVQSGMEQIAGTPMYNYLQTILPTQLAQAKQARE
jgi:tetratricopeptide (TPR) repeat protein